MKMTLSVRVAIACLAVLGVMAAGCSHNKAFFKAGSPINLKKGISIAELSTKPEAFVGQTVLLEGKVSGVCKGSGCWVEVQAADGSSFLAKSMDHDVLVPTDCEGRRIVLQGVVTEVPPDAEAEKPADGHECPRPTYLVSTLGVQLY
jgi:hypothetical protein